MNNAPNIRIEVTEGAQIPDPRDRRLLNAWTLAFCVAVVALVTLCATQPEPYLEIVKFLPDGLIITFEVTVLSLLCTLPIGNECIAMLKDTSLVSIIAVADLLRRGREFASQTFDYFETYTVIALVYLIITLLLSKGVSMMEGRLTYYDRDRK